MRRISIPYLTILAPIIAAAVVLPALLTLMGVTAGVVVDPSLSLTEAAGALSTLALRAADRRAAPSSLSVVLGPAALASSPEAVAPGVEPASCEHALVGDRGAYPASPAADACPLRL